MVPILRKLLVRDNAQSIERPSVDDFARGAPRRGILRQIARNHRPGNVHGRPITYSRADVRNPVSMDPPRRMIPRPVKATPRVVVDAGRAVRGEGLWGVDPVIPEGDSE